MLVFFTDLSISEVLGLISSFLSNRQLQVVLDLQVYSKCDQASDLRQQLELASELESNL